MADRKVLRVDSLRDTVAGEAEINGQIHLVHKIDFETHQALGDSDGTADGMVVLRATVKKVMPTLSDEDAGKLNTDQAQAIITLAGAGIDAVERLFPNAVRPEGQTSPA